MTGLHLDPIGIRKRVAELVTRADDLADSAVQEYYGGAADGRSDLRRLEESVECTVIELQALVMASASICGAGVLADVVRHLPCKKDGCPRHVAEMNEAPIGYSPSAHYLRDLANGLLTVLGQEPALADWTRLVSILHNTPAIIVEDGLDPGQETDVQRSICKILRHIFPDVIPENPIRKKFKTYRPDFCIPSLQCAVEYKYCATRDEVKKAIDGIYTDMRGYAGTMDYRRFIAVIYQTEAFFTPEELEAEFKLSAVEDRWTPILVHGRGTRTKHRRARYDKGSK